MDESITVVRCNALTLSQGDPHWRKKLFAWLLLDCLLLCIHEDNPVATKKPELLCTAPATQVSCQRCKDEMM
jgi:hypothetical protein